MNIFVVPFTASAPEGTSISSNRYVHSITLESPATPEQHISGLESLGISQTFKLFTISLSLSVVAVARGLRIVAEHEGRKKPGRLDLANKSSCCGICIPDEEQNQNHPDEWNQSRDNYDGIENVRGRTLAQIRIMTDQFERNDSADS